MMEIRELLAFILFIHDWEGDMLPGDPPMNLEYLKGKWAEWKDTLDVPHYGDCVKVPMTWTRCQVENYYRLADATLTLWPVHDAEQRLVDAPVEYVTEGE